MIQIYFNTISTYFILFLAFLGVPAFLKLLIKAKPKREKDLSNAPLTDDTAKDILKKWIR